MFRRLMIAGLAALAALGSLASVAAQDSKPASGVATSPLKESVVDLGNGVKLEMVLLPAGEFMMGSPDDDTGAFLEEKPRTGYRSASRSPWGNIP